MEMIERSALMLDKEQSLGVCCDEMEDHMAVVYNILITPEPLRSTKEYPSLRSPRRNPSAPTTPG